MCDNKAHASIGWIKFFVLVASIVGSIWFGFGEVAKVYEEAHVFPLLNKAIDARVQIHEQQEREFIQFRLDTINTKLSDIKNISEHNQTRIDKVYERFGGHVNGVGNSIKAP